VSYAQISDHYICTIDYDDDDIHPHDFETVHVTSLDVMLPGANIGPSNLTHPTSVTDSRHWHYVPCNVQYVGTCTRPELQ